MATGKPSDPTPETTRNTDAFLAWLEDVPDPQERYRRATEELAEHQAAVERLSAVRAHAAADAYDLGTSVRGLAEQLGVSPSRVHQLIQEAKAQPSKSEEGKRRRAGRQKGSS